MITFIIPAYQAEKTIKRTIDSILNQIDNRYKIIIVNDGSTDNTEDICIKYRDSYPKKITYIYQKNRGLGNARNTGIENVNTEYMAFLDSDDWLMPNFVDTVLRNCDKNQAEIILTLPVIYHEGSKVVRDWYDKELFEKIFPKDGGIINPINRTECYQLEVNACRKILKTEFVKRICFRFPEGIKWEDIFPHFYLLSNTKLCMGLKSVGFYYRVGSSSQITASKGRDRLDILSIFEELTTYIMKENKRELTFPAMRIFVRFSIWCIRMTDGEIRKELVRKLSIFFHGLSKTFYKELKKETRENYCKADSFQYRLFLFAIQYKIFRWVFYDYLYEDAATKLIKKLLGAKERVA